MRAYTARLTTLELDERGEIHAWIACPAAAVPRAGQYVLASRPDDPLEPLGRALFPVRVESGRFLAALETSTTVTNAGWEPGARLQLYGPAGNGFAIPTQAQRIILAALDHPAALLPLAFNAAASNREVALFCNGSLPVLPPEVEIHPLGAVAEALAWGDFLAVELPVERLPDLPGCLGLSAGGRAPCPAQVLVRIPMPCAGSGECNACALATRQGWKPACKDGPVFAYEELIV